MWTSRVVEREIAPEASGGRRDRVVGVQIDLLILERAPESLDEDVVPPAALAVHADADAVLQEEAGKRRAGKLGALICVEDLGPSMRGDGLLDGGDAERTVEGDRDPPAQHAAARPIEDRREIDEAVRHWDVRVSRPGHFSPSPSQNRT